MYDALYNTVMTATSAHDRAHSFFPWAIQSTQDGALDIVGGEGVRFRDASGKVYLDFLSQIFNLNLGHGNRRIIEAIQQQAATLCAASSTLMHEGRARIGRRLAKITPGDLDKAFFTNSGSEANEIAFAMARLFTGRQKVMAKYRSYHGTTFAALGTCGDPRRISLDRGASSALRFFDPYCYRCDFKLKFPSCELHCADALEQQIIMEGPLTIAAVILEPFTAAAGGFPSPPGYLRRVREICDRHGIVMIADEVICGFGRTGRWFAVEHEGVCPDILVVAKGITSGYVPMGAAIVNRRLSDHFENELLPVGCTYTAHPLACAAALAAIDEYESSGAIRNAAAMGRVLSAELEAMKQRHRCVGDVRSSGLLACIELVEDKATHRPLVEFNTASPLVDAIRAKYLQRGLFIYNRWNLILLAPPLIIEEPDLREGLGLLDEVLTWIDAQPSDTGSPLSP